jgi:antitoxin CptB
MPEDLEGRRRRLLYRSCYTGMKETDILLGGFAKAHLHAFDAGQLARYEALLETNEDPQIYAWAIGRDPVPPAFDTDVMALLRRFKCPT